MLVSCSWMRWPSLVLRLLTANFSGCYRRVWHWCFWSRFRGNGLSARCGLPRTRRARCTHKTRDPSASFTDRRKLRIFFGGRPTDLILCLDSGQLMWLKVVYAEREGDRSTILRGVGWRCDCLWWVEGPSDLSVVLELFLESGPQRLQLTMQTLLITKDLALCTSVDRTASLLDGRWWELELS
jgi:hypothetical protein